MNILLIVKLLDNSMNSFLEPLLQLKNLEHVYVLRDTIGNINSDKIIYINDQKWASKNKLRHFKKFIRGVDVCRKSNISYIIGVQLYPHGYLGRLISILTGLPYIHVTIAGHREFWLLGKFIEKINLFLFKKSYAITVTGTNTKNYLSLKGIDSNKIVTLPNVIKMERYNDYGRERIYDIVSLSRLDKNKNVTLLLKAIAKVNKVLNVNAIIAGDGPEFNNLIKESKNLAIEKNIKFAGWAEENVKSDVYNSAKIFVLCSKGEGFPLSLLEAMASGCVPIVTDVGDISDVVLNDYNGYIIKDYNNENELASIIELLIKNPGKIQILSTRAKEIKTKYSLENVEEIWEKILTGENKNYR